MDIGCGIKKELMNQDPDYKDGCNNQVEGVHLDEEADYDQATQHVVEVVVRELDAVLAQKESEALQLQEKVQACQRSLHLLRFGIASTYYKNLSSDTTSSTDVKLVEQNALHPAVLRLMRKETSGPKTRGIRYNKFTSEKPLEEDSDKECHQDVALKNLVSKGKKNALKNENEENENEGKMEPPAKIPRYIPPILPKPPEVCAASARMERHRFKRRLVVGNVSKWLPEDLREGPASHKWMLYLRGPKDSPDITDFVSKVRYFLHPSYRPHDIVDTSPPFYVSRRGWGEFPVRVQVHFSIPANKPIDIIHNLKLDRTYSGLQTLGGETVVDVWLKSTRSVENCEESTCLDQLNDQNMEDERNMEVSPVLHNTISCNDQQGHMTEEKKELLLPKAEKDEEWLASEVKNEWQQYLDKSQDVNDAESKEGKSMFKVNINIEEIQLNDSSKKHVSKEFVKNENIDVSDNENASTAVKEVKNENIDVSDNENASTAVKEDHKTLPRLTREYAFHYFPDHDYLGSNSFKLYCAICTDQFGHELTMNDHTTVQKNVHTVERDWGNEMKPKINKMINKLNKNVVNGNGIHSDISLVQRVDAEGNVYFIELHKPIRNDTSKGFFENTDEASVQVKSNGGVARKMSFLSTFSADLHAKNRGIQSSKSAVPFAASLRPGQSLLKKNCFVNPSNVGSTQPCRMSKPIKVVPGKLTGKLLVENQKLESKPDPDIELKEAAEMVSKFSDDSQAVIWLLKHLPLTNERVKNELEFKRLHPYCASTFDAFLTWPVGKRLCAERLRAKAAHDILEKVDSSRFVKWTVRHIITWARLHALTPLLSGNKAKSEEQINLPASSISTTVTEPSRIHDWLQNVLEESKSAEEMEEVNIDELIPTSKDIKPPSCTKVLCDGITVWMPSNVEVSEFLQNIMKKFDFRLMAEELCPGVMYPAVEKLLFKAIQSLSEDLLRRSFRLAWIRCKQIPGEIVLCDVQEALLSRAEFDIFTNMGLGTQAYVAK